MVSAEVAALLNNLSVCLLVWLGNFFSVPVPFEGLESLKHKKVKKVE